MGDVPNCEDHPTKQVIFWCEQCDKLVCSHCKKADHEGHKSRDIDKVANEKRKALKLKLDELQESLRKTQRLFKEKRSSLEIFEESVKDMKEEGKIRVGKVEQWVKEHKAEMIPKIDEFAEQNGRAELRSDIMQFEERLRTLKTDEQSLKGVLNEDVKHHQVLQQWVSLSRVSTTFHEDIPLHQTYLFFPDSLAVEWQKDLARFIGIPRMAEASSQTSGMATVLKMKLSSEVKALHVMSDARVCVVFSASAAEQSANAADAGTLFFGVSNHERELVFQKRLGENVKRPRLSSTYTNKVVVACTVTGAKAIFDVASWSSEVEESNQLQQHLCHFKADSEKDYLAKKLAPLRTKHYKIYEDSMDSTKVLFSIQTDNPETVVADKSGEYFAVIQNCVEQVHAKVGKRSPSLSSVAPQASVAVFKRPCEPNSKPQQPFITFIPAMEKNFHPTDICFYRNVDQNVLLVAEASGIYMVYHEQACVWGKMLSQESPLLQTTITALTTDSDGGLWIGCENGNILNWIPTDEVSKNHYQNPSCEVGHTHDHDFPDSDGFPQYGENNTDSQCIQGSAATGNTSTADTALSVYGNPESETASSTQSTSSRPFSVLDVPLESTSGNFAHTDFLRELKEQPYPVPIAQHHTHDQNPSCEVGLTHDHDFPDSGGFPEYGENNTDSQCIKGSAATGNTSTADTALSVHGNPELETASSSQSTSSGPLSVVPLESTSGNFAHTDFLRELKDTQ
ncbi:uncharacterized protein [Littorina saxatilis]|uniref:uncharacterized protein isoform X2 n=1 Tax=Littorina saxatilis TaxID=31220 RepID=UPI0038B42151